MHDLVIDNVRIIDGLGAPAREGGVAVTGGRIAAIGTDLGAARQRVDARGLVLAPGIVDIHTHYDAQLTCDPFATPSTALGVTTVVIGNCGFTIAPCRPQHRGVVPNVASFVGHSLVRTFVLGEDASRRKATDAEIAEMRRPVLETVRAGATGFATSALEQHNGEGGIPMPSRLADEKEMLALTGALGERSHARLQGAGRDRAGAQPRPLRHLEGQVIGQLAQDQKREPWDVFLGLGLDTVAGGLCGVWANGVRAVDPQGVIADCGRPGRVLREFSS